MPKLCIAVYIFKSHVKRAILIWTDNYIPVKPISVTSKCVTSKSAQIFDGKTSKTDAIVLNKFLNKLFYNYIAIPPVDGATKVGRRISMRTTVQQIIGKKNV